MADIEIYTTPICPYCWRAKRLLDQKGVSYREIDVWVHPAKRREMTERAGGRTSVPQIFADGRSLGGCDDLYMLEAQGVLDEMLRQGEGEGVPAASAPNGAGG